MKSVVTMKAVAEAAGVSTALVSYAYNRPNRLSAEARARILATASELGYAGPDPAARTLRTRRADVIGAIFTIDLSYAFSDPYLQEFLTGIGQETQQRRAGLLLLPFTARSAQDSPEEVAASVDTLRRAVIDGAVGEALSDDHPAVQVLREREIPLVRSAADATGPCVLIDDEGGGRQIGRHLRDLGHRNVTVIVASTSEPGVALSSVTDDMLFPYARLRLAGIREGLGPARDVHVVSGGRNTAEAGRAAAELALTDSRPPTAIACVTDVLALGVLNLFTERGIQAGTEISVTGFDDVPAVAAAGLTTIHQPIREKGRQMARILLDPDQHEDRVTLPTTLVPRSSSGPASTRKDRN